MKTKPKFQILTTLLFAFIAAPFASAQPTAPNPTQFDPSLDCPYPRLRLGKSPDWKGPDKVLDKVDFPGFNVSEVVNYLRDQFSNSFDIVVPKSYRYQQSVGRTTGGGGGGGTGGGSFLNSLPISPQTGLPIQPETQEIDPDNYNVNLHLRNVTASEIFNAMNMEFEAEHTPLQWKLVMNGSRPTAVLHVVPEWISSTPPPPPTQRKVMYVGDLIGSESAQSRSETTEPQSNHGRHLRCVEGQ